MSIPLLDRVLTPSERKALNKKAPKRKGHPRTPGTGPDGESCKTCEHLVRRQLSKTYLKCGLMRDNWSGGAATDVKAGDSACEKWKAKND